MWEAYIWGDNEEHTEQLVNILRREEKKSLIRAKHIDEKTKESLFDGLSISEYLIAKKRNCQDFHRQCKIGCKEICEVANMICTIVKSMETSFPLCQIRL